MGAHSSGLPRISLPHTNHTQANARTICLFVVTMENALLLNINTSICQPQEYYAPLQKKKKKNFKILMTYITDTQIVFPMLVVGCGLWAEGVLQPVNWI